MKLLRKAIQLPIDEKILFIEAVFFLFFSKVFLFLPFKFCIKQLKPKEQLTAIGTLELLHKIAAAVHRANKFAFWKNICLVKSFAARFMLERRNIASKMYLGVKFENEKKLGAHAWLVVGEKRITPKGRKEHKEIFSF